MAPKKPLRESFGFAVRPLLSENSRRMECSGPIAFPARGCMRSHHSATAALVSFLTLTVGACIVWAGHPVEPDGLSAPLSVPPSWSPAVIEAISMARERAQRALAENHSRPGLDKAVGNQGAQPAVTTVAVRQPSRVDLYGDPLPAGASARMGTTRFHCASHLFPPLALSHDGVLFASEMPDGKVCVCDRLSGRTLLTIDVGPYVATPGGWRTGGVLGFSHDGRCLLVRTDADMLELWQIAGAKRVWKRSMSAGSYCRATFSKDDKRVLIRGERGAALVAYAVADGKEIARDTVPEHMGRFDFPIVIKKPGSKSAVLRDVATGTERAIEIPDEKDFTFDFSPDGRTLLYWNNRVWDDLSPCGFRLYDASRASCSAAWIATLTNGRAAAACV